MKSKKPVKSLNKIVLPFQFVPKVSISGSVNGKAYFFQQGNLITLSFSEFEAIYHSLYAKELTN